MLSFTARPADADSPGKVDVIPAWTTVEVRQGVSSLLERWSHRLPADLATRIVIKPNLNNDLVALSGNCTDLRVLDALCGDLRRRGYTDITVADGSNVGIARRGISTFRRLHVDSLKVRHGVKLVDLNTDTGSTVVLYDGAHPQVADTILNAGFLISVPKVKTHAEAQLSCAMKNWVGICVGQDKRHMHYNLAKNIFGINEVVQPDLILVDGLVGMEGNGPGDGEPFRFGQLAMSDDAFVNDVVMARLVGLAWDEVPYLVHAVQGGALTTEIVERVARELPVLRPIKRPPQRTKLAMLAEARSLEWLKRTVRPIVQKPQVTELAYKLKIVQDVYFLEDDSLRVTGRQSEKCGDCARCVDFCPTGLTLADIGVKTELPDCAQCLYCWWVCPKDAIVIEGEERGAARQIARYKKDIEQL